MDYQDTSREAYQSVDRVAVEEQVLALLAVGPATCDEIEVRGGLLHQTASATLTGLKKAHMVFRSGEKRVTRTGRNAFVWTINPFIDKEPAHAEG